ncbi:MAG: carbohydrate ABC transporter permease [Firmicutes bacterium]|nr:carbohydrate ABC transporter permease [Bacillota bacterium]
MIKAKRKRIWFNKLRDKREGILTSLDYRKLRNKIVYALILLSLSLMAFITFFPLLYLILSAVGPDRSFYIYGGEESFRFFTGFAFSRFADAWNIIGLTMPLLNSLGVVAIAVVVSVVSNGILGYVLGVVKPKGHKIVFGAIMVGYMIPAMTGMVPLYSALSAMGMLNSIIPISIIFGANAFYLVMFRNYMARLPSAIFEAAEVDGAGQLRIFFRIVFPLSGPIISVIAIFTATAAWSDFMFPYLILRGGTPNSMTLMVRIYDVIQGGAYNIDDQIIYILLFISAIPLILIFLIFQRRITATSVTSGIK